VSDREHFDAFYDHWFPRVYALALKHLGEAPAAQVATEATFRRLLEELDAAEVTRDFRSVTLRTRLLRLARSAIETERRSHRTSPVGPDPSRAAPRGRRNAV
jgi:hypothetical protein